MKIKDGVDLRGLQPVMSVALDVSRDAYRKYGSEVVLTSGRDGNHKANSKHYEGLAVDLRISNLGGKEKSVFNEIKNALNEQWDVVLESDHIHIEFDPK